MGPVQAKEALRGLEANKYEIQIEKTRILFALNRFLPAVAGTAHQKRLNTCKAVFFSWLCRGDA